MRRDICSYRQFSGVDDGRLCVSVLAKAQADVSINCEQLRLFVEVEVEKVATTVSVEMVTNGLWSRRLLCLCWRVSISH